MLPPDISQGSPTPTPGSQADTYALPLAQDPAYLAYLRQSGLVVDQATNAYNRKTTALQAALQSQLPAFDQNSQTQQRNLGGSYEDRGMLRSGAFLRDSSELAAQQEAQRQAAISSTANGIGNEADNLAQTIANQHQQAAQAGLDAANRLAAYQASQQQNGY